MKDNKGLSLIELLIAIAILGILALFGTAGIYSTSGYPAREACSNVESSLGSLQISCLSKSKSSIGYIKDNAGVLNSSLDVYIQIYKDANGKCYVKFVENGKESVKLLASKNVDIYYTYTDDAGMATIDTLTDGLYLAYNRSTGAFIPQQSGPSGDVFVKKLYFKSGNKEYKLKLMPNTGKVIRDN